jgi:hypothetical protein
MKAKLWKLALVVSAGALFAVLANYLFKPLPSPKASLSFQSFAARGTNLFAVIQLKNDGQTMVWPAGRGCLQAEIETKDGWSTNNQPIFTTLFPGLPPLSNEVFWVDLPNGVMTWRVRCFLEYYRRHHVRLEFAERLLTSGYSKRVLPVVLEGVGLGLRLLPEPRPAFTEVSSGLLTNKPPNDLISKEAP